MAGPRPFDLMLLMVAAAFMAVGPKLGPPPLELVELDFASAPFPLVDVVPPPGAGTPRRWLALLRPLTGVLFRRETVSYLLRVWSYRS